MKKNMNITEFANYSGTSRQTLIYYDRINLFKPAYQDSNNYRKYLSNQIAELSTILTLRDLGLALEEIKLFLETRDTQANMKLLESMLNRVDDRITKLSSIKSSIQSRMRKEKLLENIELNNISTINISNVYFYLDQINSKDVENYNMFEDYYDIYYLSTIVDEMHLEDLLNGEPWGLLLCEDQLANIGFRVTHVMKQATPSTHKSKVSKYMSTFTSDYLSIFTHNDKDSFLDAISNLKKHAINKKISIDPSVMIRYWDDEVTTPILSNQIIELLVKIV